MSVQLQAIAFNHDSTSATTDALSIRRNAAVPVAVPEWQHGGSVAPAASVAAYAIERTRGRTLTVRARFLSHEVPAPSVEIRAVPLAPPWVPSLPGPPLLSPLAPYSWYVHAVVDYLLASYSLPPYSFWDISRAPAGSVLGGVAARPIAFGPDGASDLELFTLHDVQLWTRGVGVYDVVWRWQYRRGPGPQWVDFATSAHRIYVVLDVPTAPWQQSPYHPANTQLPWTDVLEFACRWARGTRTLDEAAARITRAVYDLGPVLVEYDCAGPLLGTPHYTPLLLPYFDCTSFLERLRGGLGGGRYVNCSDCATIVSTFANALGCDLWQSRMFGAAPFRLNPVLAIGARSWGGACNTGVFAMHEVAWEGECEADDEVFDACLQVDGDIDPTRPPHIPVLPANMRFGNPEERQYRDRLAAPAGRLLCQPQPWMRRRRRVF
jgi:hypothetical protein